MLSFYKPVRFTACWGYLKRKHVEAKELCERALAIREKIFDSDHPEVAASLNNLAGSLYHEVGHRRSFVSLMKDWVIAPYC